MTRFRKWVGVLGVIAASSAVAGGGGSASPQATLDRLLGEYVATDGVRYSDWWHDDADVAALDRVVEGFAAMSPSDLPRDARLAYWINLYNAVTLKLVLDHYPIATVRHLAGPDTTPWKLELVTVEGRALSLDDIENAIIRPEFGEPRIHFALNCAARSCPPLRAEAFVAERLDVQLEEQTALFLGDPRENGVDDEGRLVVSRIFDWYGVDFEKAGGSVAGWVRTYLEGADPDSEIEFREYDWELNESSA
jgi:hypothetical protein